MSEFSFRRTWGPRPTFPLVEEYNHPNNDFIVIAGPCSVESSSQIEKLASLVSSSGATHLRGGVARAGTYPGKNFGYIDEKIIQSFYNSASSNGLKNIIEVLDYSKDTLEMISKYCDCFQVGARSQQNYTLLRTLGAYGKPVFLKRHPGSTLDELLGSSEHLLVGGVTEIYLIDRGSSTFMNDVRWMPCVHSAPSIKSMCNIPVIFDAAHSTGRRDLVPPVTLAGVAAGASGILVEVHEDPPNSLSDADQAVTPSQFTQLMIKVNKVREAIK